MTPSAETVQFRPPEVDEIVAAMRTLTERQQGWITLQPGIDPADEPPRRSVLGAIFTGSGPPVPVGTWVAPEPKQKPPHAEIGILHMAGPKAQRRLAEAGLVVPDHWVVMADHPKRGLVIAVHPQSPHEEVLQFILDAAALLTRVPLTGDWQAVINGRT